MNNKELEELKNKYEELGKEIEKLEKQEKKRWRGEINDNYYCIDENSGDVIKAYEDNYFVDNFRYKIRNYFRTKEEAQKHLDKINTYYELMDLAEELNNGEEIDWKNDNQEKYLICYDSNIEELSSYIHSNIKFIGQIYCLDEDFLEKAKERIGEERLIELFEED